MEDCSCLEQLKDMGSECISSPRSGHKGDHKIKGKYVQEGVSYMSMKMERIKKKVLNG